MKIRTVIGISFPLLVIGIIITLFTLNLLEEEFSLKRWINFLEVELESDFNSKVLLEQEKAKIVIDTLLKDEKILEAFEKKDREKLIQYVMPYFEIYKDSGIYQIHFHDENLISFLRTSNLEKYGDDLKTYRKDIIKVKETKQPVYSVNPGAMGPMIRYVAPVVIDGKYIGSVEANARIEKSFSQKFPGDVIIKVFYDENKNRIDVLNKSKDELEDFTKLFDENRLLNGHNVKFMKGEHIYVAFPVKSYTGEVFAAFYRRIDAKDLATYLRVSILFSILICVTLLAITIFLSKRVIKKIGSKMTRLLDEMDKLSKGNLNLEVTFENNDELATIGKSIQIATEKLKSILNEISQVTNESVKKGAELSKISENIVSAASSASEIKSMGENTERASVELDKSIEEFAAYLEESRAEVEVTIHKIKDFTDTIEKITSSYSQLTDLVETLGSLAEKITEIADSITVLAINASIETSKQSIDRDGLSRIAEMIMELSNTSRTLAKESKLSLNNVEKTVTSTILVTEKISKDLSGVRDSLDLISNVTAALTQNVDKLVRISKLNHSSVEQMYAGVEQLEEAIINIKTEVENLSKSFGNITEAFKKLQL